MKKLISIIAITSVLGLLLLVGGTVAKSAGLLYPTYRGTATTTLSYVIGGYSTTTVTSGTDGLNSIAYLVTFSSSTTPPTLCWQNQFSENNVDWYAEDDSANASSTISVVDGKENCWTYSSTTDLSSKITLSPSGLATTTYLFKKIVVKDLDTPITRTKFYVRPGVSANLSIKSIIKSSVVQVR